jgi:hypothetical protein
MKRLCLLSQVKSKFLTVPSKQRRETVAELGSYHLRRPKLRQMRGSKPHRMRAPARESQLLPWLILDIRTCQLCVNVAKLTSRIVVHLFGKRCGLNRDR